MSFRSNTPKAGELPESANHNRKIPSRELRGVSPRRSRVHVRAHISEQQRIGTTRSPAGESYMERFTRSAGQQGRDRIRLQGAQGVSRVADKIDQRHAEVDSRQRQIPDLEQESVTGPHGETLTLAKAAQAQAKLVAIVEEESRSGNRKHDRVPARVRRRAQRATLVDFPVFCLLLGKIFNVDWAAVFALDWTSLGSTVPNLAMTLGLAAVGTYYMAFVLSMLGGALRAYKDNKGHLELPHGGGRLRAIVYLVLLISVVVGAGAVMTYRIVYDAEQVHMSGLGAWILGLFLGVIVSSMNVVIVQTHFDDGSPLTDKIDQLAEQLAPIRRAQQRLRKQIAEAEPQIEKLARRGERLSATSEATASEQVQVAERIILVARSYHLGCGTEVPVAESGRTGLAAVDTNSLDLMTKRLRSPWPPSGSAATRSSSVLPVNTTLHGVNGVKPEPAS